MAFKQTGFHAGEGTGTGSGPKKFIGAKTNLRGRNPQVESAWRKSGWKALFKYNDISTR